MNTRKLLQTTNQSIDCLYLCDSSCPYGCYPYVDLDYYIPPPSPPPPPLRPQSSTNKHHVNISPYIIISVALFASLFLLVSYYLIIVKNWLNLNRRRSITPSTQVSDEEFFDENRVQMIDHPIWYINTVGLQPSVINMITIFKFKKGDGHGMTEGTEYCSVCLNEFQEDESLKLLPNCKHVFHIHCIDTWLRSHTNCPLCRAAIVINTLNALVVSIEPNLSTNEERVLENDEHRHDIGNVNNNHEENEIGTIGDQEELVQIERTSRKEVNSKRGCVNEQVQTMRRSVSMDSSIGLDVVVMSSMSEGEKGCENYSSSRIKRIVGSGSMRLSLNKEPVLMKRSFSYSGRSFFSRHHRSRSSVLPL